MSGLHSAVGSSPIVVAPGQTGSIDYIAPAGTQSGTLVFTPLGDGFGGAGSGGGATNMTIRTTGPDGNPATINTSVFNGGSTEVPVTYGDPSSPSWGTISVTSQPPFGSSGEEVPAVPPSVPGSSFFNKLSDFANEAAKDATDLSSTRFSVFLKPNINMSKGVAKKACKACDEAKAAAAKSGQTPTVRPVPDSATPQGSTANTATPQGPSAPVTPANGTGLTYPNNDAGGGPSSGTIAG